MEKIKALFLDRDGVINYDPGYVYRIEDFEFMPGIFEALAGFMMLGYEIFIVTNQSGIGRGYYSEDDFAKLSKHMIDEFKSYGIEIKKIYHCPHTPSDDCNCRKPKPGMILQALDEFNISLKDSKDNEIISFTADEDFKTLVISNSELSTGTYYIYVEEPSMELNVKLLHD